MHMWSKKDSHSAELETVQVFKNPVTVITAKGEVQTNEEATVCVNELDLFEAVKLLEDTQAVLSLGYSVKNTDVPAVGPVVNYHTL